ncbi:hypothetical protein [Spongiactinospora sp. TRM90649]|uniref:hypothetical protein n=1 Tax=Spongiactinospora sp. TRM90649 TaxID=3031114 RepID=UPI0023F6C0F5|nr:hypothetical protein [Spongiactinospora sp. TRM90649]MDF5757496.1 hypothetical protein [Spongiactinospora sp. TRM90649]
MFGIGNRRPGDPRSLTRRARWAGRSAGRSRMFDEWSLVDDHELPYLRMLAGEREGALSRARGEAVVAAQMHHERATATRTRAEAAREEIEHAERRITAARSFMDRALAQMDRIAAREAMVRDDLEGGRRGRRRKGPKRPDDMPPEMESGTSAVTVHNELTGQAIGAERAASAQGGPAAPWEGPFGARMPDWVKYTLITLLIAIELPVQWQIFNYMDPDWRVALPFAVSVAFLMGFLPHLAGVFYRRRAATGTERMSGPLALVVLVPWLVLAVFFGDLRRRVLMPPGEPPPVQDDGWSLPAEYGDTPMRVDLLDLDPLTVSVMFAALLLLAGALAFLLGMAEDHPMVAAYRGAAHRQAADEAVVRAGRGGVEAAEQQLARLDERLRAEEERQAHRQEEVRAAYEAACAAYLDSVARTMRKPGATEAASRPVPEQPHTADKAGRAS